MILNRIIEFISQFIPYPELAKEQLLVEWKNKLLIILLGCFILIGPFVIISGIIEAVLDNLWSLAISSAIIYFVLIFVALSRKIKSNFKVLFCVAMFYMLGVIAFIEVGPQGAGFNWLFIFVFLSTFFYGLRGVLISLIVSFGTFLLLLIPIIYKLSFASGILDFGVEVWLADTAIFIVLNSIISLSFNEILVKIDRSVKREKEAGQLLKQSQEELEKERIRAKESDKLKYQFLSNMSHEIRTPINSLLGFSSLIAEPCIDEGTRKHYRKIIDHSGDQLVCIIDDIIDVAKIESNQMKFNIGSMDVNEILTELARINRNRIEIMNKKIQLHLKFPETSKKVIIKTDIVRFRQIVNNLVVNAIKFTDSGSIEVGYDIIEAENVFLKFYVKDSGIGIPGKLQKAIFERFTQVPNAASHQGAGLGLSIVKGLLDLLGGEIWVESEENKGSTFYFTIPADELYGVEEPKSQSFMVKVPDFKGRTIFVAEDDDNSYFYLDQALKKTGAAIKRAVHGEELLVLLENEIPDLVLLDINMPVLNGYQTMEKLRSRYPELPVIAQTACAMANEREKCFDCGCNEYLSKPIRPSDLYNILQLFQ